MSGRGGVSSLIKGWEHSTPPASPPRTKAARVQKPKQESSVPRKSSWPSGTTEQDNITNNGKGDDDAKSLKQELFLVKEALEQNRTEVAKERELQLKLQTVIEQLNQEITSLQQGIHELRNKENEGLVARIQERTEEKKRKIKFRRRIITSQTISSESGG